ncbi:interleukin-17A-like [Spea bombifrons]|uniref:interleukin-17A-like n=1 Tax=Spea bombifrons TaxID=233779 RepID=UPI002349D85A|nr:interleukin-17A-like [Spea bombifrons]
MDLTSSSFLLLVALLVGLSTADFLPEEYSSEKGENEETKCTMKRIRRFPRRMSVNISDTDNDYLSSLQEDVQSSFLAPWDYSLNMDPNRFPSVISEANCLTLVCVDSDGKENPDLGAHPIHRDILVLRRDERDCDYTYRLETQTVAVGCTCVRTQ